MRTISRGGVSKIRQLRYLVELSVLLVIVRVRLARQGFQPTVAWSTTVRQGHDVHDDALREIVELARAQAQHVFRWHPVANKCLEQSILLCRFLARRGIKADLTLAACKYPFESHAWAHCGELLVTDPPERHPERFRVIARF